MKHDYDIVIVGSGVAGALCAWKLSTLGPYKILILEAGDNGIGEGQRLEFPLFVRSGEAESASVGAWIAGIAA